MEVVAWAWNGMWRVVAAMVAFACFCGYPAIIDTLDAQSGGEHQLGLATAADALFKAGDSPALWRAPMVTNEVKLVNILPLSK